MQAMVVAHNPGGRTQSIEIRTVNKIGVANCRCLEVMLNTWSTKAGPAKITDTTATESPSSATTKGPSASTSSWSGQYIVCAHQDRHAKKADFCYHNESLSTKNATHTRILWQLTIPATDQYDDALQPLL